MRGSGESSLAIWTAFDTETTATTRHLKHVLKIAWLRRRDETLSWATVGSSVVGGTDIVKGAADLTKADIFDYYDETDYVLSMEYERFLNEPLGGIALAQADISLDNTSLRFTPNKNATIGTALMPNRPIKLFLGFRVDGQDKVLQMFEGLTWQPEETKLERTCEIHAFDFIQYMFQYKLESTIYINQRSDEIIKDILDTIGFSTDQYELDTGLNTIGYAWFSKNDTAGERIRKICEAEEAVFYQDEEGILRFENRRHFSQSPHDTVQWTFDDNDILDWQVDKNVDIINRCVVKANPRTVQTTMEVWRDGIVEEVERGETKTIWASFENPCTSFTAPVATTDYVANSSYDGSGADMTSDISISFTGFTTSAKFEITNNGKQKAYLTLLRLRGTPATVTSAIEQSYEDSDSIETYEEKQFIIENDFIDSNEFARYLARAIVEKYKKPLRRVKILVRGVPHLQLRDKVNVYDRDLGTYKEYRVMGIHGQLKPGEFLQWLTLREVTDKEADSWAIVGTTQVGATDEFVGI